MISITYFFDRPRCPTERSVSVSTDPGGRKESKKETLIWSFGRSSVQTVDSVPSRVIIPAPVSDPEFIRGKEVGRTFQCLSGGGRTGNQYFPSSVSHLSSFV